MGALQVTLQRVFLYTAARTHARTRHPEAKAPCASDHHAASERGKRSAFSSRGCRKSSNAE